MRGVHLVEVFHGLNCRMYAKVSMTISMTTHFIWSSPEMNQSTKPTFSSRVWLFLQSLFKIILHCRLLATFRVDDVWSRGEKRDFKSAYFTDTSLYFTVLLRTSKTFWSRWSLAFPLLVFDTLPIDILYLPASVRYEHFSLSRINSIFSERANVCFVVISRL